MDLLFEILIDMYVELMMSVIPEADEASRKYRIIALAFALTGFILCAALFVWGGVLLFDRDNKLGLIPIVFSVAFSLAQIIVGLVIRCKKK